MVRLMANVFALLLFVVLWLLFWGVIFEVMDVVILMIK